MANTKFYFDCRRTKPGHPSVLKIAIGHKNTTAYISLDAKLMPEEWDNVRERVINHPDKQVLNAYINEVKQKVDSIIINLTRDGKLRGMTAKEIKDIAVAELNPEEKKNVDETLFIVRFLKFIEPKKKVRKKPTCTH